MAYGNPYQTEYERYYKKIEYYYHAGCSSDEITNILGISKWTVVRVMQDIFAREQMRKEGSRW